MADKLTAHSVYPEEHNSGDFPLFLHYEGQFFGQQANITLNMETGGVGAYVNKNINSEPTSVANRIVYWFPVSNELHDKDIKALIDLLLPTMQTILDGSTLEWFGSDLICELDRRAGLAYDELYDSIDEYVAQIDPAICLNEEDFMEANGFDWFPKVGETIEGYATRIVSKSGLDNVYLEPGASDYTCVRHYLVDECYLPNLDECPKHVLQDLLADEMINQGFSAELIAEIKTELAKKNND